MTIDTFGAAHRCAEIRCLVTIAACNRHVLACEGVGRATVIEIGNHRCSRHAPARRLMALLAGARKPAIVRIAMAARTLAERDARKSNRQALLLWCVTPFASHAR